MKKSRMELTEEEKKKIEYLNQLDKQQHLRYKDHMMTLLEMGFNNFKLNLDTLAKHKGSVEAAANDLAFFSN